MSVSQAYPVSLVGNFADAVREHNRRAQTVRPPASTDMMILRALLAHPLVERTQEGSSETPVSLTPARTH